jgi:hypothetical protein
MTLHICPIGRPNTQVGAPATQTPAPSQASPLQIRSNLRIEAQPQKVLGLNSLRATKAERALIETGQLDLFWASRIPKDPVARVGLGTWGSDALLQQSIEQHGGAVFRPASDPLTVLSLRLHPDFESSLKALPKTTGELKDYWRWMGNLASDRLEKFGVKSGALRPDSSPEERFAYRKEIGVALAKAHVAAIDDDAKRGLGDIPGLLSAQQIATVHHEVFKSFGLPANTFGGTPFRWVPDALEIGVGGGLWANGSDSSD